jgi:hypothetical protein
MEAKEANRRDEFQANGQGKYRIEQADYKYRFDSRFQSPKSKELKGAQNEKLISGSSFVQ